MRPTEADSGPTSHHAEVLRLLIRGHDLRGNLVSGAHLAVPAIDHGLPVVSADSDFAPVPEARWIAPCA
jgi:hypothetical protein